MHTVYILQCILWNNTGSFFELKITLVNFFSEIIFCIILSWKLRFWKKKQLCLIEQHIAAYSNSDIFFTFKMKCFSFDQDATASTSNYSKPLTVPKFREFVLWVEHKLGNVMIFVILAFFVRELPSSTCHCCCNDFSFVLFRF